MTISSIHSSLGQILDHHDGALDSEPNGAGGLPSLADNSLSHLGLNEGIQVTRTDPLGAASDACTGFLMVGGAAVGAAVGFAIANGPGALAGMNVGGFAGTAAAQFVCDAGPKCTDSDPRGAGPDPAPDAGAPATDTSTTPPTSGSGDQGSVGGVSLANGGGESNGGNVGSSGDVSTSSPNDPSGNGVSSGGANATSDGTERTSSSGTSAGDSTSSSEDNGRVGGTSGGSDLPADDGTYSAGGWRSVTFDMSSWAASVLATADLGLDAAPIGLGLTLGLRA